MPAPEPRRVIIHAGFHKTGTTSVQRILKDSHASLSPYLSIILKLDIADLCATAHDFARAPSAMLLARYQRQARACFASWPTDDIRPLLISAEDLCGQIPGRNGRVGYPQAPLLMAELVAAFPDNADTQIYLSTRERAPWLMSCYGHHLRHAPMRMSEAEFREKQAETPTLSQIAADIADAVGPTPVTTMAIEDVGGMPQGVITPLLDLAGLTADQRQVVRPLRKSNPSMPPDILKQFLILNRTETDATKRNAAKQALITAHRGKGQT